MKLRVGTRRSPLALTQTRQSLEELVRRCPGVSFELVEVVTTGDRIVDRPLREAGGKGLFLKELDEALLEGRIDCAVHSMKDVPTDLAPGTTLAAVLERADARDVLVTTRGLALAALPAGAVIGTTSLRRQAQALATVSGATIRLLRGNVQTRLQRLAEGHCDATFLAAAGLGRLGIDLSHGAAAGAVGVALDPFTFVPAPGQGTLAITARSDDAATIRTLEALDHAPSRIATLAERGFARVFGGGCHLPLAAYANRVGDELVLVGLLVAPDGSVAIRDEVRCELRAEDAASYERAVASAGAGGVARPGADAAADNAVRAEQLGESLARTFFARGAQRIIDLAGGPGA